MVEPRFRQAKTRKKKSPKGRPVKVYKGDKESQRVCALCGAKLHGVPRDKKNKSKTEKRPERVFGGVLCGKCVQSIVKERARLENGYIEEKDVPVKRLKFLKQLK
jgi:large subunit ribosomal protein L34e